MPEVVVVELAVEVVNVELVVEVVDVKVVVVVANMELLVAEDEMDVLNDEEPELLVVVDTEVLVLAGSGKVELLVAEVVVSVPEVIKLVLESIELLMESKEEPLVKREELLVGKEELPVRKEELLLNTEDVPVPDDAELLLNTEDAPVPDDTELLAGVRVLDGDVIARQDDIGTAVRVTGSQPTGYMPVNWTNNTPSIKQNRACPPVNAGLIHTMSGPKNVVAIFPTTVDSVKDCEVTPVLVETCPLVLNSSPFTMLNAVATSHVETLAPWAPTNPVLFCVLVPWRFET